MKVTYTLSARQAVPCSVPPVPLQVGNVEVIWDIQGTTLAGVALVMRNQRVSTNPSTGAAISQDAARALIVFRVASLVADSVYALSGIDAFDPQEVATRSPQVAAETPQEATQLSRAATQHTHAIRATAAIAVGFNGARLITAQPKALAIAHYARAMRTTDPLDKVEALYKVIEALAPKRLKKKKVEELDKWVSSQAIGVDPQFTKDRAEELRHLRNRVTHPQAQHGHLSPHELQHIQEAEANLPDLERLARILIWDTPTPWK